MEQNLALSQFTTFKIGGIARYFFRVKNMIELENALSFSKTNNLPFYVLGGGSNILASDDGFEGVIIKNEFHGIEFFDRGDKVEVVAESGESWDKLVALTIERGLHGLENLSGIPGTVGASPIQNIGAYGSEVGDRVHFVETFDCEQSEIVDFSKTECQFGYRTSIFKNISYRKYFITKVSFMLSKKSKLNLEYKDLKEYFKGSSPSLSDVRQAVLSIRASKFPDLNQLGTAGSFFKNPIIEKNLYEDIKLMYPMIPSFDISKTHVKIPLAWILDHICNLKGYRVGDVGLFENQPLVFVNYGKAKAKQINKLADYVSDLVKSKTGIELEREVVMLE